MSKNDKQDKPQDQPKDANRRRLLNLMVIERSVRAAAPSFPAQLELFA